MKDFLFCFGADIYCFRQIGSQEIIIILLMQRLKKKELQLLRLQKEEREEQQKLALKGLIKSDESIAIMIKYAEDYLRNKQIDSLSQYSPIQISRLIFDKELEQIRSEFQKLPNQQIRIQHFILILIKIMKFPFQKAPLYMVGLKDMFYEIVQEGKQTFTYPDFFKYILGEFVTMKEEEQNTEFQVQILQRKKQDYLLHDNGIKRVYYSKDMKMTFSLDERSNSIKIYDQEMKNINKFSPKKQKHNNKFPIILDFDYSEITERLGLVLSDETLSTVHLANFLERTPAQFQAFASNEVVYNLPQKMKHIFFIQMMNKWLTVSDEGNKVYLFDMQRIRTQPQKVMTKLKLDFNDQNFSNILQIVSLSCVCVIAGNEVNFYNENFSELRFKKFTHHEQIKHFKYSDEKNQFYLCGLQKSITIFSINRSGYPSKIRVFPTNKIVNDFQVFPYFDTIVIADENNDIKLVHQSTRMIYQQINYSHIVKAKDKNIKIYKISKNEFAIYQTYLLVMSQQKIAIERDTEYSFLPYYYFDQEKEELYLSVNNQLLSFSILSGQIRKNFSFDSSNIEKHHCFFMGHRCPIFVLDYQFNIFEVYQKDELMQGQNKSYRKKINIQEVLNCFYDLNLSTMIIANKNSFSQVRNDKNNNFNLLNTITLQDFSPIVMSSFCQNTKIITFLTSDQLIYQFKNYHYKVDYCYRFIFPKDYVELEDKIIVKFHYDSHYDIFIILNNKNQIYFIDRRTHQQLYFNLTDHMPAKLKKLQFKFFSFQLVNEKKSLFDPYLLVHDDTGFLVQFSLKDILEEFKFSIKIQESEVKPMFKETQVMTNQDIHIQQIRLTQENKLKRSYEEIGLMKAHEKTISIAMKLRVEILVTLTISVDGYIRLWNSKYKLLFSLKIPSLVRISWDMKEIEEIKKKKSINQLLNVFKNSYYPAFQQHPSPIQVYNKSKKLKKGAPQIPKINLNDPIKLEIENKDIQQIVMQKQDYSTFYGTKDKSRTQAFFHTTGKIYPHPWRKNKEFVNIFSKASSPNKYNSKMPNHLIQLRSSLDMTEKIKQIVNYKEAERLLPQLSMYEPEKFQSQRKKDQSLDNEEEAQNFESCLYVKKEKKKKKINEFDEIDKQFKKKDMVLTARKWVPKKRRERNTSVVDLKPEVTALNSEGKIDPIKAIQRIFEQHNRQCLQTKKGRLIRVPKISINKDLY